MKIILRSMSLMLVFTLLGAVTTPAAETISSNDWKIYYDFVEEWHRQLYITNNDGFKSEEIAATFVSSKYNMTNETVYKLVDKVVYSNYPSEEEWKIYDDLMAELNKLPKDVSQSAYEQVHREVANKYNLSMIQLYNLEFQDYVDYMWW